MARTREMPALRRTLRSRIAARPVSAGGPGEQPNPVATAKTVRAVFGSTEPAKREVRDRAYYIYLARGGANGDPVADWNQAECELREELRNAARSGRGI